MTGTISLGALKSVDALPMTNVTAVVMFAADGNMPAVVDRPTREGGGAPPLTRITASEAPSAGKDLSAVSGRADSAITRIAAVVDMVSTLSIGNAVKAFSTFLQQTTAKLRNTKVVNARAVALKERC